MSWIRSRRRLAPDQQCRRQMLESPDCAVCGDARWIDLSAQTFVRQPSAVSSFVRKRLDVVFDLWRPGTDEFTVRFERCEVCGFVGFRPRPTADDIDRKYAFLGGSAQEDPNDRPATVIERRRSREIHRFVAPFAPSPSAVLDFGGGRGALMASFAEAGARCGVVDFTDHTIPGVERWGNTLDAVQEDARFDLIVCSHVLEHLAEPGSVVEALSERVAPEGLLFVEVPLQIVGGVPTLKDPVTHINFFSANSLRRLLEQAGLDVMVCRIEACTYYHGGIGYGVRALACRPGAAIAKAGPKKGSGKPDAADENDAACLLRLGPAGRLRLMLRHPKVALSGPAKWKRNALREHLR